MNNLRFINIFLFPFFCKLFIEVTLLLSKRNNPVISSRVLALYKLIKIISILVKKPCIVKLTFCTNNFVFRMIVYFYLGNNHFIAILILDIINRNKGAWVLYHFLPCNFFLYI